MEYELTSVIIPDSVQIIWGSAFAQNRLTRVTIPDGVITIWASSFAKNKLISVTIPESVREIEELAFASNQLTSITISARVQINDSAFDDIGFIEYYEKNGSRGGTYTLSGGTWSGVFVESTVIEPEINGTYQIVTAYANIYGLGRGPMDEVPTRNLGTRITISGDKALFGNVEYQLYDASPGPSFGKYSMIEYSTFLIRYGDLYYGPLRTSRLRTDYEGMVKVKRMINDRNNYTIFFADDKLIVEIRLYEKGFETETEFIHLAKQTTDHFLYIAEKVTE
jgi:hypothetical protein